MNRIREYFQLSEVAIGQLTQKFQVPTPLPAPVITTREKLNPDE